MKETIRLSRLLGPGPDLQIKPWSNAAWNTGLKYGAARLSVAKYLGDGEISDKHHRAHSAAAKWS